MRLKKLSEKITGLFSLRTRLIILVTVELIGSILLAQGLSLLLNGIIWFDFKIPLLVELLFFCLIIGVFVTDLLSRYFFSPIKKLQKAMEKVTNGDFKVQLETKGLPREIKEIYSGFNIMVKELGATEMMQSDWVSNVSHEFKTPISAIEGYATLLQDCGRLNDEEQQYVEKIYFNTKRLSGLVGNILLLSKLDNQTIQSRQTRFRLDEQIRQSIVMLEPAWEQKEIEFDVEMDSVEYVGNESLLHHVWDNLIGNAIKFNPQCGMVRIKLFEKEEKVVFIIEDSGPGISNEAQKHVFDKFYQADSSHKEEGNGLGLALVKQILSLSNGEIALENIAAGGCRFTVILNI